MPHPSAPSLVMIVVRSSTMAAEAAASLRLVGDAGAHAAAAARAACSALLSLPDAILGSPGGARGRLSVDPRLVRAASDEMRDPSTGMGALGGALTDCGAAADGGMHGYLLAACEKWARFVPVPPDFVERTAPLAGRYLGGWGDPGVDPSTVAAASAYLIAVFESATLRIDQILAVSVGMSPDLDEASHQMGRKKASSKSKKRRKERLQSAVNDGRELRLIEAQKEKFQRGEAACRAAAQAWGGMATAAARALESAAAQPDDGADVEGPIGCVCASVSACLPHLIRRGSGGLDNASSALFTSIMEALRDVCASPCRAARVLSYGPINAVHSALKEEMERASPEIQDYAVDCIFQVRVMLPFVRYPPSTIFRFSKGCTLGLLLWQGTCLSLYTIIHELTSLAEPKSSLFSKNTLNTRADAAQFIVLPSNSGCSQMYLNGKKNRGHIYQGAIGNV